MRPLVIYSYILQHFFNSSCRRDILRLILSWKFPGKLLCITLFFTSCHWYNIVVYFTKKMPNILGEFKGKICSECISHNLEFQNYPVENPRTPHLPERGVTPSQAFPHLGLRCSVRASGTPPSPYFINWDSYFNSFWEPWICQFVFIKFS